MNEISPQEFYQQWQETSLHVLDVREVDEFVAGHVPDSHNLPLSQLEKLYQDLDENTEYHVICQAGKRSEKASAFLDSQGYRVVNVQGGVAGFPGQLIKGEEV